MTQQPPIPDIAVLIVTYNSAAEIGACLDAVRFAAREVLVIDNGSSDDTCDEVRRREISLIANTENRGFAAAVNQGVRATTAPLLLLLNPDALLARGLDLLQRECEVPGVAAAGGMLTDASGLPQRGFMVRRLPTPAALAFEALGINRLWPRNPVNWRFRCLDLDPDAANPVPVEQPAGAFFLFRRDAWERLGGFDERFHPLWFEDVDFCRRLQEAGLKVTFVPQARAIHAGAHSIRKMPLEIREIYWYGNLLKYATKHYQPLYRRLVCSSVIAGAALRFFAGLPTGSGAKRFAVYWKVVRLASRCFAAGLEREVLFAD